MGFPRTRLRLKVPGNCGFCKNRSHLEMFGIKQGKIGEMKMFAVRNEVSLLI